jgi:peptidyl-tRNA hydrolase
MEPWTRYIAEQTAEPLRHYILLRRDLPPGVMLAQTTHAAGESAARWSLEAKRSLPADTHAVVLAVPDERSLLELEQKLITRNIPHCAIREPDAPWNGQLMAIGLWPADRKTVKRVVSNYPLVR